MTLHQPDPEPAGRCELCGFPVWAGQNPQISLEEPKAGERHSESCEGLILPIDIWSEELMEANKADEAAARAERAAG